MRIRQFGSAVAMLALTALAVRAQEGATPVQSNLPRLEVPQVSFNFGYVPQGSSISHVFWLKNVGGDTLRITDVRPG